MIRRTLKLRREALTELTPDVLNEVVGAQALSGRSCPVLACTNISDLFQPTVCNCQTGACE